MTMRLNGCWNGVFAIGATLAALFAPAAARGDDFRIESKVFAHGPKIKEGEPQTPVKENVTLFYRGIVYDYSSNPLEITILDPEPSRARFILLNPSRQQKLEIKLSKIEQLIDDVKKAGLQIDPKKQPFMQFCFNPAFQKGTVPDKKQMVLESEWMRYELTTMPAPTALANDQYRQFSDWFAQLNSITSLTAMPPFARLQVNEFLHAQRQVPVDVKLTLKGIAPGKKDMIFTSTHTVMWKLLDADLSRIEKTDDMFVKFMAMPPQEYFKEDALPVANNPKETKPKR